MPDSCCPMDCTPPGSPVIGISQPRILEGVAVSFSRGSSRPRDRMYISYPVLYTELYVTVPPLVDDAGTDSVGQCMWTNLCDRTLELMFPPLKVHNLNLPDNSHYVHLFFSLVQLGFLLLMLWILYLGKFFISVSLFVSFHSFLFQLRPVPLFSHFA